MSTTKQLEESELSKQTKVLKHIQMYPTIQNLVARS